MLEFSKAILHHQKSRIGAMLSGLGSRLKPAAPLTDTLSSSKKIQAIQEEFGLSQLLGRTTDNSLPVGSLSAKCLSEILRRNPELSVNDAARLTFQIMGEMREKVAHYHLGNKGDDVAFSNVLALLGDREGGRSRIIGDFSEVYFKESIGTRTNQASVNAYFDPQTGLITAFGNLHRIPKHIIEGSEKFRISVSVISGRIKEISSNAENKSLERLVGLPVAFWMR
jgi:hypothetical protein